MQAPLSCCGVWDGVAGLGHEDAGGGYDAVVSQVMAGEGDGFGDGWGSHHSECCHVING